MKLEIQRMGELKTGVGKSGNEWQMFSFQATDGNWYSGFVDKRGFGKGFAEGQEIEVEVEINEKNGKTYRNVKPISKEAARLDKAAEAMADLTKRVEALEEWRKESTGEPTTALDKEFDF